MRRYTLTCPQARYRDGRIFCVKANSLCGNQKFCRIIVSIITGICSIIAVAITSAASGKKLQHKLEISQAVMNSKLESLTNEVRAHNEFARRMPVIEEQIKVINHRLEDLEREHHG